MNKKLMLLTALFAAATSALPAQLLFTANHDETEDGPFNAGRVRTNTFITDSELGQWQTGTVGTAGDGRVWHSFVRFKMSQRNLLTELDAAGKVTYNVGVWEKKIDNILDPVNGGHDIDVYLVLDPNGTVVPDGESPGFFTAFDWANEFANGYANSTRVGTIPQTIEMAQPEDLDPEDPQGRTILVETPSVAFSVDVTSVLKQWISGGLLTENSTIAFGFVQRHAVISDGQGNPKLDDPNLYINNIMGVDNRNSYLKLEEDDGPANGPGEFVDYELVDGYVDTGDWMGWVFVGDYPWAFVLSLDKFIYTGGGGWFYISK